MNDESLKTVYDLMYLCACGVKLEPALENRLIAMDIQTVFNLAKKHKLDALVSYVLQSYDGCDAKIKMDFFESVRRRGIFDSERTVILKKLEDNEIWYMPLKGVIMQDLYPVYGMRQMADNDILFDASKNDKVKPIMESLGFTIEDHNSIVHDGYTKEPVLNFEMHKRLFPIKSGERINSYYENVFDRLLKDEDNNFGYHFSDEDFYVYFVGHAYKHYTIAGTGLRTLVDIYVYINHFKNLDWDYIHKETDKLGISDFEKTLRSLSIHVIDEEPLSDDEREMFYFIASSGTYGTIENQVKNALGEGGDNLGNKIKYIFKRLSIPISKKNPLYEDMKAFYPKFYEHKILLPLLPFYRLYRAFTVKRNRAFGELHVMFKKKK